LLSVENHCFLCKNQIDNLKSTTKQAIVDNDNANRAEKYEMKSKLDNNNREKSLSVSSIWYISEHFVQIFKLRENFVDFRSVFNTGMVFSIATGYGLVD
jgi:hypothetical protein